MKNSSDKLTRLRGRLHFFQPEDKRKLLLAEKVKKYEKNYRKENFIDRNFLQKYLQNINQSG